MYTLHMSSWLHFDARTEIKVIVSQIEQMKQPNIFVFNELRSATTENTFGGIRFILLS